MRRRTRYFAQNGDTDEFEEVTPCQYEKICDGGFEPYVYNIVLVHDGDGDTVLTMYDVDLENVAGCVIAGLCRLFKRLGLQTDF